MPSAIGSLFNSLVGDIRSKTISAFLILSFLAVIIHPVKIINNSFLLSEEKKSFSFNKRLMTVKTVFKTIGRNY